MRITAVLGAVLVLFACGESTAPEDAVGTYALTTVGGQPLPYIVYASGLDTALLTSSVVRVDEDNSWLVLLHIEPTFGGAFTNKAAGTWTLGDTVLSLTETPGGQTHTAALSGADLVVRWNTDQPAMVYERAAMDNTAPTVQSRSPVSGATAVPTDLAAVVVTFSELIDGRSLAAASFSLTGPDGPVAGGVDYGETWATWMFEPTTSLTPSATYTATVAGAVTDLAGNPLGEDVTWSFTTAAFAMEFVLVPAGTFQMGDEFGDGGTEERPVHTVTITRAFYIGKYEVTQAQWRAVMGSNPAFFVNCGADCPVEAVSWEMVQQFIAALNTAGGRAGCTTESGCYRLPTEAEWEYAAKGGAAPGDGTKWAGSNTVGDVAWYSENSGGATHPVGQKAPNGLGLHDMSGNVLEWVQDWYNANYYTTSPGTDPGGPSTGTSRGLRSGPYHQSAFSSRVATRNYGSPTQSGAVDCGFRLVRVQ